MGVSLHSSQVEIKNYIINHFFQFMIVFDMQRNPAACLWNDLNGSKSL